MTGHLRIDLAAGSVAGIGIVNATALTLGPENARPVFLLCGIVAFALAVQSAGWDPIALPSALLLSLPPVISLLAFGSPTWLIGPLGALLLASGELNAMSWDCREEQEFDELMRRRLWNVGQLGALGLAASLLVAAIAAGPPTRGTLSVIVASIAVGALGWVIFGRKG